MCGINGIVYASAAGQSNEFIGSVVQKMNNDIIHRGPDDDGVYLNSNIGMGMRRLSIIDLKSGKQPIYNDDKSLVITFNGEIYNYKELRAGLISEGITFNTESDTEVVLKLYEKYKSNCVQYLEGMFTFSVHDVAQNSVFIVRDRFGEKPLYYSYTSEWMAWASELKSIRKNLPLKFSINKEALIVYLALTYIPAPLTIYENIYKLEPGHFLEIQLSDLSFVKKKYWDIQANNNITTISYEEAQQTIRKKFFEIVKKQMIADVPLGVFLSGGVDSTIVAAVMSQLSTEKIKTFSIGFENKQYDESERAQLVARHIGSEHHQFTLNYHNILNELDKIVLNYDEPFADASALPTYFVSNQAVKFVKVALTGDGGDETFGGYNKYLLHTYGSMYQKWVPGIIREKIVKPLINLPQFRGKDATTAGARIRKLISSVQADVLTNHLNIIALGFRQDDLQQLLPSGSLYDYKEILKKKIDFSLAAKFDDKIKQARYIDKQTSLEGDMLAKVDRASMLCSIECRAPLLHHQLMEFSYTLPDEYLIKGNNKKRILKDTFQDLLPAHFFNAPKTGFGVPIAYWLRNELKEELLNTLKKEKLEKHGLFNTSFVDLLINEHLEKGIDRSWQLWTLFCFQKWFNVNMAN